MLSLPAAALWFALWDVLAMLGAYLLNPVCFYLFIGGAALEIVYCLMLRVSHLRSLISGLVKTTGAVAAVFAVDPRPSPWFLVLLWAWLYCWEIAGQNVPADLYDVEEDGRLGARTLPVVYGPRRAGLIVLFGLGLTIVLGAVVLALAPLGLPWPLSLAAWVAGLYLLLLPAWRLWRSGARSESISLFNRSSYYPLAMLAVAVAGLLIGGAGP